MRPVDTLVSRLYRQRGLTISPNRVARGDDEAGSRRITLEAFTRNRIVGTVTVGLDGPNGLDGEDLFRSEIAPFRRPGARLCEFTRLALELDRGAKGALACLFHAAYVVAYRIEHASDLFIEVHPRHANFYRRRLGFEVLSEPRMCGRVNAPAVLLHKTLREFSEDLMRFGGFKLAKQGGFYSAGLTPWEEQDAVARISESIRKRREPQRAVSP